MATLKITNIQIGESKQFVYMNNSLYRNALNCIFWHVFSIHWYVLNGTTDKEEQLYSYNTSKWKTKSSKMSVGVHYNKSLLQKCEEFCEKK